LSEHYAQPLEEVLADVQELLGQLANVGLISSVATSGAATVTLAQP
ncbi:MAG: PqqD family protein, partial [Halomonadaceae bacterium]|nr:PqqD family protein [Halomonadaceae bacterium]